MHTISLAFPATIGFSRSRYMVIEDTEEVSVTVQLQSGNILESISLRIYTQPESATGKVLCSMLGAKNISQIYGY